MAGNQKARSITAGKPTPAARAALNVNLETKGHTKEAGGVSAAKTPGTQMTADESFVSVSNSGTPIPLDDDAESQTNRRSSSVPLLNLASASMGDSQLMQLAARTEQDKSKLGIKDVIWDPEHLGLLKTTFKHMVFYRKFKAYQMLFLSLTRLRTELTPTLRPLHTQAVVGVGVGSTVGPPWMPMKNAFSFLNDSDVDLDELRSTGSLTARSTGPNGKRSTQDVNEFLEKQRIRGLLEQKERLCAEVSTGMKVEEMEAAIWDCDDIFNHRGMDLASLRQQSDLVEAYKQHFGKLPAVVLPESMMPMIEGEPENFMLPLEDGYNVVPNNPPKGKPPWVCIDFGPNAAVSVTSLTLEHGMNINQHVIRTFKLQGSATGREWTTLLHVKEDTQLFRESKGAWMVDTSLHPRGISFAYTQHLAFRFVRIVMVSPTNTKSKRLTLSNFRLQGVLYLPVKWPVVAGKFGRPKPGDKLKADENDTQITPGVVDSATADLHSLRLTYLIQVATKVLWCATSLPNQLGRIGDVNIQCPQPLMSPEAMEMVMQIAEMRDSLLGKTASEHGPDLQSALEVLAASIGEGSEAVVYNYISPPNSDVLGIIGDDNNAFGTKTAPKDLSLLKKRKRVQDFAAKLKRMLKVAGVESVEDAHFVLVVKSLPLPDDKFPKASTLTRHARNLIDNATSSQSVDLNPPAFWGKEVESSLREKIAVTIKEGLRGAIAQRLLRFLVLRPARRMRFLLSLDKNPCLLKIQATYRAHLVRDEHPFFKQKVFAAGNNIIRQRKCRLLQRYIRHGLLFAKQHNASTVLQTTSRRRIWNTEFTKLRAACKFASTLVSRHVDRSHWTLYCSSAHILTDAFKRASTIVMKRQGHGPFLEIAKGNASHFLSRRLAARPMRLNFLLQSKHASVLQSFVRRTLFPSMLKRDARAFLAVSAAPKCNSSTQTVTGVVSKVSSAQTVYSVLDRRGGDGDVFSAQESEDVGTGTDDVEDGAGNGRTVSVNNYNPTRPEADRDGIAPPPLRRIIVQGTTTGTQTKPKTRNVGCMVRVKSDAQTGGSINNQYSSLDDKDEPRYHHASVKWPYRQNFYQPKNKRRFDSKGGEQHMTRNAVIQAIIRASAMSPVQLQASVVSGCEYKFGGLDVRALTSAEMDVLHAYSPAMWEKAAGVRDKFGVAPASSIKAVYDLEAQTTAQAKGNGGNLNGSSPQTVQKGKPGSGASPEAVRSIANSSLGRLRKMRSSVKAAAQMPSGHLLQSNDVERLEAALKDLEGQFSALATAAVTLPSIPNTMSIRTPVANARALRRSPKNTQDSDSDAVVLPVITRRSVG